VELQGDKAASRNGNHRGGRADMSVLRTAFCGWLGFGVLGTHELDPDIVRSRIVQTRALTDRPFGVNIIIVNDGSAEDLTLLAEATAVVTAELVLFWGDPGPYVAAAHAAGMRVFVQVGSMARRRRRPPPA
jgi:NAD(P)H-dependent flavin oxidoreductase YrpB (nitropropane dioxygenase family)